MKERKPWVEYPHFWKTEAEFWGWLRGCLRRGIWEKSPIKLDFKNRHCTKPPPDYKGRAKSGTECALSGEWVNKSKLEVDHVQGNQSLLSWDDLLPFILHLIPPDDEALQLVSKEAHKVKSHQERKGFKTFEEALADKQAIVINGTAKNSRQWLEERDIVPASTALKRRVQIREKLLEEMK